jgi:hypothetical protein
MAKLAKHIPSGMHASETGALLRFDFERAASFGFEDRNDVPDLAERNKLFLFGG